MADKKPAVTVKVNDDKTHATVRATMLPLDAKGIEDAIGAFATARSHMMPAVPPDFPADHSVHRHTNPHYYVAWDFLGGMPSISFRSPAFGWLSFLVPAEQIEGLCQALSEAKALSDQAKHQKPH
jgi:hypothetical protein